MPIYAYRCEACGFAKDALQKVSDAPLTVCPSCSQATFKKQITAAGFQLKGTGWYVTDFRGGSSSAAAAPSAESKSDAKPAEGAAGKSASAAAAPAASASTPASPASSTSSS